MAGLINNDKYSLYYQRISLMYQKPEIKASLEVIMSVFTVVILIFAAIRPTMVNIATLQKKIDDQETANKKADLKISQLLNAQSQLTSFQDKLLLYDEAVPDKVSFYDMSARIEALARLNSLTVESFLMPGFVMYGQDKTTGESTAKMAIPNKEGIVQPIVSFTVKGLPQNVRKFIGELENMDRLSYIKNLVFTKELGQSPGQEVLKLTGQIYFYFFRQQS